jgi:hypothetical protein
MLRDVPNILNAFHKEGFDPPICNHIRNVNTSFLLVDLIDCHDELVVTVPPAVLFALPPPIAVLSLVRGFSLSLTLTFAKDCLDGLLVGGVACHEVEQLLRCPRFAASKLMDECFIGVPEMNALITSTSTISGSSLHFLEKRRMYSHRVSPAFCL